MSSSENTKPATRLMTTTRRLSKAPPSKDITRTSPSDKEAASKRPRDSDESSEEETEEVARKSSLLDPLWYHSNTLSLI